MFELADWCWCQAQVAMGSGMPWITCALVGAALLVAWRCAKVLRIYFVAPLRLAPSTTPSLPDLTVKHVDGHTEPLSVYRGSVLILVNSASRCGFTAQYRGLEALWQRFREQGLQVLAVPTNDFLGQEPLDDAGIATFCETKHGVTFPMLAKATLSGANADPLYRYIQHESVLPGTITWNFEKLLIDRAGRLRARIAPRVAPEDPRLIALVEMLLAESESHASP
jgi:glutathione peroxidase